MESSVPSSSVVTTDQRTSDDLPFSQPDSGMPVSVMLLKLRRYLRRFRRTWIKLLIAYATIVLTWDTVWLLRTPPPERVPTSHTLPPHERYFIASIHWNNEGILRSHWNNAVLDLVKHLGAENTYVAVLEGGSWDNSKGALQELEIELSSLGVPHTVTLEKMTHKEEISRVPTPDEPGWVWTSRGRTERRRIPYLANLRNRVMAQMAQANDTDSRPFTKVLWLNDVVFTVASLASTIITNADLV